MTFGTSIVGHRFGRLLVLRAVGRGRVEVKCDCGKTKEARIQYLLDGQSKSCGCGRYDRRGATPVAVGDVFGRLVVVQDLGTNGVHREVLCRCECGNHKVARENDLRRGHQLSCGCLRRERARGLNESHGDARVNSRTPIYRAWDSMRVRVKNHKQYPTYAGLEVYEPWQHNFIAFRDYINANLGPRPDGYSLDRIDNAKGYLPGNLRWAPAGTQVRNRRSNVVITVDGVSRCVADWAALLGVSPTAIHSRLKRGVPPHLAIAPPFKERR